MEGFHDVKDLSKMKYTQLGKTDMIVSSMTFGTFMLLAQCSHVICALMYNLSNSSSLNTVKFLNEILQVLPLLFDLFYS